MNELRRQALTDAEHFPVSAYLLRTGFIDLVAHPGPDANSPGPYLQDIDLGGAICCTAGEAMLLYLLALHSGAQRIVEVGSYVGWSAAHMATALKSVGGTVYCVDPMTECERGAPMAGERMTANLLRAGVWEWTDWQCAPSPQALPPLSPWDVIFIDGEHNGEQPLLDVQAAASGLRDAQSVIAVHGTWMPDVAATCAWLRGDGFMETIFHAPHMPGRMGLYWREPPVWWGPFLSDVNEQVVRL